MQSASPHFGRTHNDLSVTATCDYEHGSITNNHPFDAPFAALIQTTTLRRCKSVIAHKLRARLDQFESCRAAFSFFFPLGWSSKINRPSTRKWR